MLIASIGEGSNALYCLTDLELCCSAQAGRTRGRWMFPGGSNVDANTANFYSVPSYSSLLLNRRSSAVGPIGEYSCLIPDGDNNLRTIAITISTSKEHVSNYFRC